MKEDNNHSDTFDRSGNGRNGRSRNKATTESSPAVPEYDVQWASTDFQLLSEKELIILAEDLLECPKQDLKLAAYDELMKRCFVAIFEHLHYELKTRKSTIPEADHDELINEFITTKLLKALPLYRKQKDKKFQAWLAVVWNNFVKDYHRRNAKTQKSRVSYDDQYLGSNGSLLLEAQLHDAFKFDRAHDQAYIRLRVKDAIASLKYIDRKIVIQYYFHGEELKSIAEDLGLEYSAVKVRLYRARLRLRADLASLNYDSS